MSNNVKSLWGSFVFVGTPMIPKEEKNFYSNGVNDSGYIYHSFKFGVKTSDNNLVYVELMGGYQSVKKQTIYTFDKDNNKLEVDWRDRNDAGIIDTVADFKKFKANFASSDEKESKVFIAEYDFISDVHEFLPTAKDQRIVVMGNVKLERYKGQNGVMQTTLKYNPTKIRLAKDDELNKADVTMSFVFDKNAWDEGRLRDEKKVDVSTYFTTYVNKEVGNIFVPLQLVLNCDKLDMENPKHKGIFDYYKSCFKASKKEYFESQWHCQLVRGSEEKEITMDDLTADQKMQIELGLASFEQIKRDMRGKFAGDRISELRLIRPTNKFDGSPNKLTDYEEDDFFAPIEQPKENKDNLFNNDGNNDNKKDDIDSLFGID